MKHLTLILLLCLILLPATPVCAEETHSTQSTSETVPPPETLAPAQPTQTSHTHAWITVTVPSTCAEQGGTVVMCSTCEEVESVVLAPLAEHTYTNACDTDCNTCGQTRPVEHTLSTGWDYNSRKHWHVCTVCGEKGPESDHYPGPAATEERDQFCLTCGLLMTKRLEHTHRYEADWESDDSGHWHVCQGCETQGSFAAHRYADLCDSDCEVCGHSRAAEHSFGETFQAEETGHWQECLLCGERTPAEEHTAGESEAEDAAVLCEICSWELVPEKSHVHKASGQWEQNESSHWQLCQCGEKLNTAAHAWKDGACSICGAADASAARRAFPWGIVLAILTAALAASVAALVCLLKRRRS